VDYGSGETSEWNWSIVKTSDSSTVSGITIDSGVISISPTLAAGSYAMTVTTVDWSDDTRTATVLITINKAQPVITISPRIMMLTTPVPEATANRQIFWKIETTHRSAGAVAVFVNGTNINCFTSIQFQDGQCWWSSSTANSTISAYATFAGDSNLETATSNVITGFKVNAALSLAYSDTSTYSGIQTFLSPTVSGGTGSRTYQIFQHPLGDQVFGISIDTSTGIINVSRSVAPGVYRMQVRVDDITGANELDNNVQITVLAQQSPAFTLDRTSETVNKNSAVSGYAITHSSTPGFIYSISPALPSGLLFSTITGEIYGAPTAAQSATTYTITAVNNAGSETATFTLAVSEQLVATISVSIGTNPAAKGTANTIVATISAAGKVQFYIDGKRVPGCVSVRGTTSVTCNWKPVMSGKVTVQAKLTPTNGSIPAVTSTPLQVSIGRRTGLRG
jgi:hypothetical protein